MTKVILCIVMAMAVLVAPAAASSSEAGHEEQADGMISVNPTLLLYQVALFSIFVFIMYRLLYKRLGEFMRKRSDGIKSDLEEAKRSREEAEDYREEYRKRITSIEAEIEKLRNSSIQRANDERDRMIDAARVEAEDILTKAKNEIQATRDKAMTDVRNQIASIVEEVTYKVLEGTVSVEREKALAEKFITEASEQWKK